MSLPILTTGSRIKARLKNQNLQDVVLAPTPENKRLVQEYTDLAKKINGVPARIAGLHMNYRKTEIPAMVQRLLQQREDDMQKLLEMEKTLFPKKP